MKKLFMGLLVLIIYFIPFDLKAADYIGITFENEQRICDVFIDTQIQPPNHYRQLFFLLNHASETDTFIFHINTHGGDLETSLQLYNTIKNTKAKTIANIFSAYSGGAFVAMACKKVVVNDFAIMMIHSFISPHISGSISELKPYINFFYLVNNNILSIIFKDFLYKNEIYEISQNKIIWLDAKSMRERFKKVNKFLE